MYKQIADRISKVIGNTSLTHMFGLFVFGGLFGFVLETVYCFALTGELESRRGLIYIPFAQIYGLGAVFLALVLRPLAGNGDGLLFLGGALAGGLFEAGWSYIQELLFGSVSWDYSDQSLSFFGGRTSAQFMIFWGVLSLLYIKLIYPRLIRLINRIPRPSRTAAAWILAVLLCADAMVSGMAVSRWSGRLCQTPPKNAVELWLDRHYEDAKMTAVYPNMLFTSDSMRR